MDDDGYFRLHLRSLEPVKYRLRSVLSIEQMADGWQFHISQRIVLPKHPKNAVEVIHLILRVLNIRDIDAKEIHFDN
jgi:hypothetical protein